LCVPRFTPNGDTHRCCDADSGHGGQTKDLDGDEADGYDEGWYPSLNAPVSSLYPLFTVIYPVDYETAGDIVDDARF
jgi:hypothetical protein